MTTATRTSAATTRSRLLGPRDIRTTVSAAATDSSTGPAPTIDHDHHVDHLPLRSTGSGRRSSSAATSAPSRRCGARGPRRRARSCTAAEIGGLVGGPEHVQVQRAGGPVGLEDDGAGHQGDLLGGQGQVEVGPAAQLHPDDRAARHRAEAEGQPDDVHAGAGRVDEQPRDQLSPCSGRNRPCRSIGGSGKTRPTSRASSSPVSTRNSEISSQSSTQTTVSTTSGRLEAAARCRRARLGHRIPSGRTART